MSAGVNATDFAPQSTSTPGSATSTSDTSTAWQASLPVDTTATVQGTDSLYLTAAQQKAWENNIVFMGTDGNPTPVTQTDPDRHRGLDANGDPLPGGRGTYSKTPEQFLEDVERQAGEASAFAAEASKAGANPRDYAQHVLTDTNASDGEKALAGAWLGYASLQSELDQAGFYTQSNGPMLGGGRATDFQALTSALEQYFREQGTDPNNPNPTSFFEFLQNHKVVGNQNGFPGANSPGGGSGSSATPKTFNPSSPDVISQQGDAMAQQELGHSLNQTQTNQLIGQVQGQEANAYNQGDFYLRGVTPASLARDFIVQNNLPEYTQHQAEGYMNALLNMFLSGNSSRANTTVGDVAVGDAGGK